MPEANDIRSIAARLQEELAEVRVSPTHRDLRPLGDALVDLERDDPAVGAAAASYEATRDRIIGRGPGLSHEEIRRIYNPDSISSLILGNEAD